MTLLAVLLIITVEAMHGTRVSFPEFTEVLRRRAVLLMRIVLSHTMLMVEGFLRVIPTTLTWHLQAITLTPTIPHIITITAEDSFASTVQKSILVVLLTRENLSISMMKAV